MILSLPAGSKPAPQFPVDPPHLLANWVNITGHDNLKLQEDGSALWHVHWQTGDNPDSQDYHFFNHLIDQNDQRIAQADAAAFSPQQWAAGDRLISRFLIPEAAADDPPASMRVGMYVFPSLENVPLLDIAGNPYVDAATFFLDNNGAIQEN